MLVDFSKSLSYVTKCMHPLQMNSFSSIFGSYLLSYGPPWAHYLGGYQDRLLGGPLGLPDLRCTVPDGVKHKDYGGKVLG
jgi:hypothetical protein